MRQLTKQAQDMTKALNELSEAVSRANDALALIDIETAPQVVVKIEPSIDFGARIESAARAVVRR